MDTKQQALAEILAIAREHRLDISDIESAFKDPSADPKKKTSGILPRLFAYLGATFVFAGITVFIGMHWEYMNAAARIIITLGSGIAVFVMALVVLTDERYEKASTPLFLIAAALQPTGLLVTFSELSSGGDWRHAGLVTSAVMLVQQLAIFQKTKRTTLLFTSLVFAAGLISIALDLLNADNALIGLVLGLSLLCVCVALNKTMHQTITPFWYFAGSTMFLYSVFDLIERSPIEILFLAAACGMVYLSTYVRSRTLLIVSTLAILGYIGYFSHRHFLDSMGWPIALVVFGLLMIALSALAFRINKKYIQGNVPPTAV